MRTGSQSPACPEPLCLVRPVLAAGDLLTEWVSTPGRSLQARGADLLRCYCHPAPRGCPWPAGLGNLPVASPLHPSRGPLCSSALRSCCDAWQWGAVVTCQALALACLERCDALAKPFNHPDPSWQLEALPWGTGVGAVGMVLLQGLARVSTP